jgi:hypothetical protein
MRTADDLIHKQEPARTTPRVLDMMTQDNSHVVVSISRQRAYLMLGDQIGIDTPISSGKAGHETPTGSFTIQEKDPVTTIGASSAPASVWKLIPPPAAPILLERRCSGSAGLTMPSGCTWASSQDTPPRMAACGCRPTSPR